MSSQQICRLGEKAQKRMQGGGRRFTFQSAHRPGDSQLVCIAQPSTATVAGAFLTQFAFSYRGTPCAMPIVRICRTIRHRVPTPRTGGGTRCATRCATQRRAGQRHFGTPCGTHGPLRTRARTRTRQLELPPPCVGVGGCGGKGFRDSARLQSSGAQRPNPRLGVRPNPSPSPPRGNPPAHLRTPAAVGSPRHTQTGVRSRSLRNRPPNQHTWGPAL